MLIPYCVTNLIPCITFPLYNPKMYKYNINENKRNINIIGKSVGGKWQAIDALYGENVKMVKSLEIQRNES